MAQYPDSFLKYGRRASCVVFPACLLVLSGCADRIHRVTRGEQPPPLYPVVDPGERARNVQAPALVLPPDLPSVRGNSLWQAGSRSFLKDQRASRVGDIVRIHVSMKDNGKFENLTTVDRKSSTEAAVPNLGGVESKIARLLPKGADPAKLLNMSNTSTTTGGQGSIERSEEIVVDVPALVVQILDNGYFMIQGSQEIRLGQEVRRLMVQGILRPEDIDTRNVALAERLTEARIFYGGEGDLTDIQRPGWAARAIDQLSPF